MNGWPLRYRLWRRAHLVVSRLAWRFDRPGATKSTEPHGGRWWRVNDWLSDRWQPWYWADRERAASRRR